MKKNFTLMLGSLFCGATMAFAQGNTKAAEVDKAPKATEGEWVSMGKGKYRDDVVTTFLITDYCEFEVEVEKNTAKEGLYRLVSPYKNYPYYGANVPDGLYMEIDCTDPEKVFFYDYETGMDIGGGNIWVSSIAGNKLGGGNPSEPDVTDYEWGKIVDGNITFNKNALITRDISTGTANLWKFANCNGMFRVRIPGALEYVVDMELIPELVEQDGGRFVAIETSMEKDAQVVRFAMCEGENTDSIVSGIIDGTIPSQEVTQGGKVLFPLEKNALYNFVAVPYYEGTPKKASIYKQEVALIMDGWENIGQVDYHEGYLCDNEVDIVGIEPVVTPVECHESVETPGRFRLVNPYGPPYPWASSSNYDSSRKYYMVVDASDPTRVYIEHMENGCGLEFNVGVMHLSSRAERYMTQGKTTEEIDAMGVWGKWEGNEITFPIDALCIGYESHPNFPNGGGWYWANETGKFKIVLPKTSSIENSVVDNTDAPVEYYTLQGVKVGSGAKAPGIYVKKQGTESTKVIIK